MELHSPEVTVKLQTFWYEPANATGCPTVAHAHSSRHDRGQQAVNVTLLRPHRP
ncbi:hypothetical protein M404DRAFT_1006165 [Pisolithus tinctorius Marx 270]|uniref:Uncharacterized protein n=1 Tax=Pisolithus tinctorius Marx 270 TaxID=870435 RepID=A0A0C3NNV0_PISTI|nr:hypothetical protein M404DRAFT_1006165 [Pisolithus tinctorius Marx 270]